MVVLMVKNCCSFLKKGWIIYLAYAYNFLKSEPEYAYKRYAYKKNL